LRNSLVCFANTSGGKSMLNGFPITSSRSQPKVFLMPELAKMMLNSSSSLKIASDMVSESAT